MPRYTLTYGYDGAEESFTAKDADDARRKAADRLGRELMIPEGTVTGPNGQTWELAHDGWTDGRNGWTSGGKNVFPKQTPRAGTLWKEPWTGIYEMDDGTFLMADESTEFSDEDFALVGAVYYAIYDDSGEIDGGWFGYDEDGTWKDFVRFVSEAHHAKVGKCIYPGGGDGFYDIVSMLEDGTDADEIYEECGVPASRSVRSKPKSGKPKTVPKAKPRKAPAKTSSDSRRSKAAPKSKPKGKARPAKGVRR